MRCWQHCSNYYLNRTSDQLSVCGYSVAFGIDNREMGQARCTMCAAIRLRRWWGHTASECPSLIGKVLRRRADLYFDPWVAIAPCTLYIWHV